MKNKMKQMGIFKVTLLLLLIAGYSTHAQLSNYCFTATTGTYAYNSGGTSVSGIQADDANVTSLPIGFTFNYMGSAYTQASVSSNGWLSFTNGNPSATNSLSNSIVTTNASLVKTLFPLWDDLSGSGGIASYQTSGSSPNRIFTMEWKSWKWNYNAGSAVISFQVKLYETSDVVEFWYKQEAGSISTSGSGYTSGASIGLNDATGGSGHYLSLNGTGASPTANTSTATDNLLAKPATNQVYRFTPWSITTQPATQGACLGNSVTFSVAYNGTGTPTFQWKKGGVNISGATNSTYNIASVATGDAATYTVVITYSCSSLTSTGAVLTVNTAPSISVQPASQTICTGQSVTFSITAGGTSPTYQWRKGGTNISGATLSSYTIASIVAGDAANYDVVVSVAGCSSVTSGAATLTVNVSSTISTQPSSQTICNGNSVTFTVAGSGNPAPTYQWKKGGTDISGATLTSYSIATVSGSDAATYTVVLTNSCNAATSNNAILTVNTPPSISVQPVTQTKCAGNSVTFSVSAGGTSPTYQWRKGGVNISGGTNSSYTIASVAASDAASYDVVVSVTNCTSLTSSGAALTVNPLPTLFTVNGGGVYCSGGSGVVVGLSGSQSGVNYQLKIGGVATGSPVAGNGSAITYGNQTSVNTYTVDATNAATTCAQPMTGSVAVSTNPLPTAVSATPASSTVCANATSVALTGAATTSSTSVVSSENFNGIVAYLAAGSGSGGAFSTHEIFTKRASGYNTVSTTFNTPDVTSFILTAVGAASGNAPESSTLTSPLLNTTNFTSLSLSYQHTYKQGNSGAGTVEVSTNGGTNWIIVKTYSSTTAGAPAFVSDNVNLNSYINNSNFKIRFHAELATSGFNNAYWGIDNVILNGNPAPLFSWTANTGAGVNGLPGGAGTGSAANKNITINPSATTVYTMTAADAVTGCSTTTAATVTINPAATVSAGSNQTICEGSSATMNGSFGGGASSATWSTSGNGSFNNNNGNAIYTPSANDISAGSVTLTYTTDDPAGPCGAVNASMNLTINAVPSISTQPIAVTLCENGNATFSISASGTGISYQWRKGTTNLSNGGTISGATSATLHINGVVTGDAASDYNCVVSGTCTPALTSNSVALVVNTTPSISSVGNLDVNNNSGNCNATVINSSLFGQISYSGSPAPSVTFNPAAGSFNLGTTSVTATAANTCGSVQSSFNVIVHDIEAPVPNVASLPVLNGECSVTASSPTATDNCAGAITATTSDALVYNAQGNYTIHWNYSDGNGNTSSQNQTVTVADISAPVPNVASLPVLNGECSVTASAPTATDNCAGVITATTSDALVYNAQGNYTIHWNYSDGNGNTSSQNQTVTVADISAPVPDVASLPALNSECSVTATAPTATDNCAGTLYGTTADALVYNAQGSYIIHWNYNDGNGNSITQNQSVLVQDVTAPVPVVSSLSDINAECSASAAPPIAIDNCAGTITATTTDATTYSSAGNYTIHWVYNDGNGNTSSQNQTVIVTLPAATISGNNSICTGNDGSVHVVFSGTAPFSYTISDGTQTVSGNTSNAVEDIVIPAPSVGTHNYTLTVLTDANCAGTSAGSAIVNVNPAPDLMMITSITGASEGCNGTVAQLTANIANNFSYSYSWNTGINQSVMKFSNSITGPFVSGPFTTTTNTVYAQFGALVGASGYNVGVNISNSCGNSGYFYKWVRGIMGTPGTISGSPIACASQSGVSYSVVQTVSTAVYNWTFSTPGAVFNGQGTNNVSVTFPSFTSGQLCVTAALSCGGSSTSAPRCLSISNTTALPSVITGAAKVCPGSTNVTYSVTPLSGAASYSWTVPSGTTIVETAPYSNVIHVNFPSTYSTTAPIYVYGVSACGVQSAGRNKSVGTYIPNTPGSITGPVAAICNSTVQYSISNVGGATGYVWAIPAGATNFMGQGTTSIQFNAPVGFTTGNVTVTATSNACTPGSSAARTISVSGAPSTPGVISINPSGWCVGQTINASVATASPLPTYNWIITSGSIDAGQGSNNVDVITGNAHVIVQVRAINSCGISGNRTLHTFSAGCREEEVNLSKNNISVSPNPAHDNLTVSIDAKQNSDLSLTLTDISGRIVLNEKLIATAGMNRYEVNLNTLSKGVYVLQAGFGGTIQKTKVVIE